MSTSERVPSTKGGRGRCAACAHGDQATLNAELAVGRSFRSLSMRFGISRPALKAHKQNHLSPALIAVHSAGGAGNVLEQLHDLITRGRRFLETAELMGNSSQGLQAIRELRETLVMVARATGELEPPSHTAVVDLHRSSEWIGVRSVILDVLKGHPQLKRELSSRLLMQLEVPATNGQQASV